MKKKMTKAEVKELLRKIIVFEVGKVFQKNNEAITRGLLNGEQITDLISDTITNYDFVSADDVDDRLDEHDFSDAIQSEITNMDLVDEDKVSDVVRDEINNFDFEHDIEQLQDKTRRINDDISETEVEIIGLKGRMDKQKYDFEKKIAELKKEIDKIKKGV